MSNEIKVLILVTSLGYSQCDTNYDNTLDILDVVIQVDCILSACWDEGIESEEIEYHDYTYETVWINDQHWMSENLRATHYNNGDIITNIEWDDGWTYNYEPACADYDEDETNSDVYGKLYNWFAVNDERGICPEGWHLPSYEEYMTLASYLGGDSIAGYKMKDTSWDGSNQSHFNGIPGGCRASGPANGDCCMSILGHFWTSTESGIDAVYAELESNKDQIMYKYKDKRAGKSVRCLED